MTKLAALLALYFAQGLPFGVQATVLPLVLRERGASLQLVGFASVLSFPWLLKALWAPLVDRYGSARFGRRKSWIVPMQAGLSLSALLASQVESTSGLAACVMLMNLFAATQDIAVDGLAIGWLARAELGPGNAVQVIGYKLGMLTGGGLLVWASGTIGLSGVFLAVALLMLAVLTMSLFLTEEAPTDPEPPATADLPAPTGVGFREIAARLRGALARPGGAAVLAVVVSYKLGESLADGMWKPLLLDRGFSAAQIGLWSGTLGMICSLTGSAVAGALVRRHVLSRALLWIAGFRTLGIAGEWWISARAQVSQGEVIGVTCFEHLAGGAITPVVFALMMRHTDRRIGATQFTLLASLEVLGKQLPGLLSGVLATQLGYAGLFALATLLAAAFVLLVRALDDSLRAA